MLLTRAIGDPYHSQMHLWLYEQFSNEKGDVGWDKVVTALLSDSGRTTDVNPDKDPGGSWKKEILRVVEALQPKRN